MQHLSYKQLQKKLDEANKKIEKYEKIMQSFEAVALEYINEKHKGKIPIIVI